MTPNEAAKKWKISPQRVRKLLSEGRVPGATLEKVRGQTAWVIPDNAKRPEIAKPHGLR